MQTVDIWVDPYPQHFVDLAADFEFTFLYLGGMAVV
jgi:hypothetical protein